MSKIFFPQLDYLYRDLVYQKNEFNLVFKNPSLIFTELLKDTSLIYNNNIFNMLLNNSYLEASYNYYFVSSNSYLTDTMSLKIGGTNFKAYICDSASGDNILNIADSDILMLDFLLEFRKTGTLPTLPGDTFNFYDTKLSKLIFLYFWGKIYSALHPDYTGLITTNTDLVYLNIYEDYVIREIYSIYKEM